MVDKSDQKLINRRLHNDCISHALRERVYEPSVLGRMNNTGPLLTDPTGFSIVLYNFSLYVLNRFWNIFIVTKNHPFHKREGYVSKQLYENWYDFSNPFLFANSRNTYNICIRYEATFLSSNRTILFKNTKNLNHPSRRRLIWKLINQK